MRSTYEVLTECFSQNTIDDMILEYEAMEIYGQHLSEQGPIQLFRDRLRKEGYRMSVVGLANSAINQYCIINQANQIKKNKSSNEFKITSMTVTINDEEIRKLVKPDSDISIGYRVVDNFDDHHQDALKYKKED